MISALVMELENSQTMLIISLQSMPAHGHSILVVDIEIYELIDAP